MELGILYALKAGEMRQTELARKLHAQGYRAQKSMPTQTVRGLHLELYIHLSNLKRLELVNGQNVAGKGSTTYQITEAGKMYEPAVGAVRPPATGD